ncbi:MAG: Ig-like domain-containing protein [Gammaproteobacteria bacterium]
MNKSILLPLSLALFLAACGGGGGGGGGSDSGGGSGGGGSGGSLQTPSVTIISIKSEVEVGFQTTLEWSSRNATSCNASGAWSGTKGTGGTEVITVSQAGANTYTLSCSNSSSSASSSASVLGYRMFSGKAFDGYISGAEIFVDTNDNKTKDEGEFSTSTDTNGDFNLRYENGTLISKNGTDLDTQTPLTNYTLEHRLSGYTESKIISPITSLAAYLEESSNINAALGIDDTIDISITDPIPNKDDKGTNSYLYEKGAQATVLALALNNIANTVDTQTQDITTSITFDMIAKELEAQYNATNARVDIEREDFLAKVVDRLSETLTTSISDANKATVSRALSNLLPIIQVKDNAEVTIAAMSFALNLFQEDIPKLATGTASSEVFNAYQNNILSYIATDQGINADELAPDIIAIDDNVSVDEDNELRVNVLNNDSYLTAYEIGLTVTSEPSNGTVIKENDTLIYQPEPNYNGSDSFTYQINQGTKVASATVNISINSINDAPELNFASSFTVEENSTLVGVMSASDVDGDTLEISLSGSHADLFTIDSNTFQLSFKEAPDYESGNISFAVTIVAKDAEFTVSRDISISVSNLNDNAPTINGPSEITIAENSTRFIGRYDYSDADGDSLSLSLSGADSNFAGFNSYSGYIEVNLNELPDYEEKGQILFDVVVTDGTFVSQFSVVVTITNEFEELTSFGSIDEPITTNADGTFILGEDLSSGRPVYYMQYPGSDDWYGYYARDFGSSEARVAASGTGTEFVTGEKNGSCATSTSGQGSMAIYVYYAYRSPAESYCFQDGMISGNAVDISYDGKRVATSVYVNNDHSVAIYDYSESSNNLFEKVQTLQIGGDAPTGNGIALSGDGSRVAWVSSSEISVWEWGQEAGQQTNIFINSEEGKSVDLNGDGTILAYSKSNGEVKIMDISDTNTVRQIGYLDQDTWKAEPFNMTDQANGSLDWANIQLSLDQTGTFLAIGFPNADNNVRDTGKVALYKYTDENWELYNIYSDENAEMSSKHGYVALTSDASKVAIGTEGENSGFFEAFPNRNKQPEFDLTHNNNERFIMSENTTRVTQISATDEDGDDITYSFHGKDANFFQYNNGYLEFKQPPNYENPKSRNNSNRYSVTFKASDSKNYDYRFFDVEVRDETNESPPTYQIWGPSREYGLGQIDLEMSKDGKRLAVLSDRNNSSFKGIDIYEYDGNNYNLYYSRTAFNATSISISGDGTHIAWTKDDSYYALNICDITDSDDVDCYSFYTAGELLGNATDIDLNFDASAVILGSSEHNNNTGRAYVWRRAEMKIGAWDANLGGGIEFTDVGYTGRRVQISDDGNRVAVVANRYNDATGNPAVKIYQYQDDTSYQAVNIIRSEYQMNGFGNSIDWSSDGRYVVVGSPDPRFNNNAPASLKKGAVYIYDCSNTNPDNSLVGCTQVGDIILGDYEQEWFGWRVAINDAGDLILASSLKYPESDSLGENRNGRVRAYSFSNGSWSPTGYEYIGNEDYSAAGQELDLSADGALGVFSEPYDSSGAYRSGTIHLICANGTSGTCE